MAAWVDFLNRPQGALYRAPCGCECARVAETNANPVVREKNAEQAIVAKADWRCPGSSLNEPTEPLPDHCMEALQHVERITGARELRTCPNWYAQLPWVKFAASAHTWRDKGALHLRVMTVTDALVEAIDAIDDALASRLRLESEERRAKNPPPQT